PTGWFGKKDGRLLLREAEEYLAADPLGVTRNLKTLRPNPVAQRELRLRGGIASSTMWMRRSERLQASWSVRAGVIRSWFREGSVRHNMKVIALSEAKAKLGHYGRLCQDEPIVVTVKGVPVFHLASLDDDDLIDRLLAENPEFRRLLEMRAVEPTVSLQAA